MEHNSSQEKTEVLILTKQRLKFMEYYKWSAVSLSNVKTSNYSFKKCKILIV
jgi:hypothetical protein